jgi:glycosyltransferase involved in cell wall biosynthesis
MTRPLVSVVMETVTAQTSVEGGALADRLAQPLAALAAQTYDQDRIEPIIVVGAEVPAADHAEIARRFPQAIVTTAAGGNYLDAKNRGAAAAGGDIVTFLDGDCTPEPEWLETLIARFESGVDAVAGCVRYEDKGFLARAVSIPDFAYILEEEDGQASGFNLGNVAFRRPVLIAKPLDARLVRNGGCYNLFHQLKAEGASIVYEPAARVSHALDFEGLSFMKKHWARGRDGVDVYRLDERETFRGTRWYRRLGPVALVGLTGRRILIDWARLYRHRRQIGISTASVPFYAGLGAAMRLVELAGSIAGSLKGKVSAKAGRAGKAT